MRLPVVPFIIAATLLAVVVYLFNTSRSDVRVLDVPKVMRLADIEGVETEIAIAADGNRYAVISSGDLWVLDLATGTQKRLTQTPEAEMFPTWSADGRQITFTRGGDTFAADPESGTEQLFRTDASWLSWSTTSRTVFVRGRALWIANPNGRQERQLVDADPNPDITIQTPRFSPDNLQIAFIKSQLGIRSEVWLVDVVNGMARPLISDRTAENAVDVGWILEGRSLAYLTDRAGSYSIWHLDLTEMTILPLTQPLVIVPLARLGMSVWQDRMVLPRHFINSDIVLSDTSAVAHTDKIEFEPAVSPDGSLVAYTIADDNRFEVWTSSIRGENATFRALGREPRFAANNFELVYTYTDITGNADIWKVDIRNGSTDRITDADEIDVTSDWSRDGRSIAFASARGEAVSIWTIPSSGGKRLRVNDGGYAPRFSPDSRSILFWNRDALWTMDAGGGNPRLIFNGLPNPMAGTWESNRPVFMVNGEIRTADETLFRVPHPAAFPQFDVLRDGRFVIAPIDILETALWAVDLTYKAN